LLVFAIFRPVEYSTGQKSAEYRPGMLQLPYGSSQKKMTQVIRIGFVSKQFFVIFPQNPKITLSRIF